MSGYPGYHGGGGGYPGHHGGGGGGYSGQHGGGGYPGQHGGGGYEGGYGRPPPPDQYGRPPYEQQGYDSHSQRPEYHSRQDHGPPPGQYGGGYGGQYPPPNGPPRHDGYGPPSHSPYPQHGAPPPQQYQSRNQYAPPPYAPPPGLDSYGYSTVQGYGGTHRAGPPPPQTPQSFGHGAPAGYTFQYSNCTGKRKALLIGINYFGQGSTELKGCINDTKNLSQFLIERYGYKREDMIILTDDAHEPMLQPTKQNMIRAMGWLVDGAQPNDALFLHYSGHGGQTEDLDGDEDDGFDETIYPVDYKQAGHIDDDELHHIVVKPLVAGVRLTAIFDSCHSGSVLDLPYIYSTKGVLKEPNLAAEAGQGLLKAFSSYASGDTGGVASALMGFAKSAYKGNSGYKKTVETKTSAADVIMWSGSKDDQTSADATVASTATGAMSWAFVTALKQDPKQSYVELLNSIRDVLETKYTQKPQLSSSHPLDTDLLFVM